jgi:hypothetical protein
MGESIMERAVYPLTGSQRIVNADLANAIPLPSIPTGAQKAEVSVEGGSIRVYEGETPTTTAGGLLSNGQWDVYGPELSLVRLIRTSDQASLVVQVSYFSIYPPGHPGRG